jgi:2-dehydropantoate 2-reductase
VEQIVIIGTGALACLFAARLAANNVQVTLMGSWREGISALNQQGVRLESREGTQLFPVRAVSSPEDIQNYKYAFVLVKSWQTERAAAQIAEFLSPDGLAVTLQNGLGNLDILERELDQKRVTQGVTTAGATLLGPAHVRQVGPLQVSLGKHPRIQDLDRMLQAAGFLVQVEEQLESLVWKKLMINSAINPLTAVLQVPNGRLLELPGAQKIMTAAAQEVADLAKMKGLQIPDEDPWVRVESVARSTAQNLSSMLQDIRRGAPTEIEAISGAVVKEAARFGMDVPINFTMLQLVRSLAAAKELKYENS